MSIACCQWYVTWYNEDNKEQAQIEYGHIGRETFKVTFQRSDGVALGYNVYIRSYWIPLEKLRETSIFQRERNKRHSCHDRRGINDFLKIPNN